MGLREFRDGTGVVWQVWSVTSEVLDKRTAAEDYMRDWQDGWLCFENPDSRRRLAHFPPDWEVLEDEALCKLLDQAQAVKPRRSGSVSGEVPAFAAGQAATGPLPGSLERAVEKKASPEPADTVADEPAAPRRRTDDLETGHHRDGQA